MAWPPTPRAAAVSDAAPDPITVLRVHLAGHPPGQMMFYLCPRSLAARLAANAAEVSGDEVTDLGPEGIESVDYPDYGYRLAEEIAAGRAERGIALCGTGIGISIACNRHPACRCARVSIGSPASASASRSFSSRIGD